MASWKDTIPLNPDDQKFFEADELAHDIENCFDLYDAPIKIKKKGYDPRYGDGFKFEVNLIGGIKIGKVKGLVETVQYKLRLPALGILQKNGILYFITATSHPVSSNNELQQIFETEQYKSDFAKMEIAHPVGVDDDGNVIICDLKEYPHAMVCGTTNSGKSMALKCLFLSLMKYSPDKVNLIVADKGDTFNDLVPAIHLSYPFIIREPEKLAYVLLLLNDELERRNVLLQKDKRSLDKFPYIVCIIDEFPWFIDYISRSKKIGKVVNTINDILRYGRHTKINLILAIHDPKNDIAIIEKSDLPVQLAFQAVDSRKSSTAMGGPGAEKLQGYGDMMFHHNGKSQHLMGVKISDEQIIRVIAGLPALNSESYSGEYVFDISDENIEAKRADNIEAITFTSTGSSTSKKDNDPEEVFALATIWVLSQTNVSINSIQNCGRIPKNYGVASTIHQKLYEYGILGDEKDRHKRNKVLPQSIEDIPDDLKECLSRHGISDDDIAKAISKRQEQ